jgi:hypothetical protein
MKSSDLRARLRKDRRMTSITVRMPEDVVKELKRVATLLGFSGYQPLIRAYIGQGLRRDLEKIQGRPRLDDLVVNYISAKKKKLFSLLASADSRLRTRRNV